MLERNEDRDALRALANAIISWKFHHAHNVEGFREVDKCLVAGTPIGKFLVERYEIAEQITDIQDEHPMDEHA
jgi:hypothetical protein